MGGAEKSDFFLSRRGSVAAVAREVEGVLSEKGYKVVTQDYDIAITANFIEGMHEAIKNARDLIVLFTRDYETSPYTRKEFTSFEADRAQSTEERRVVILRCEDVPLRGLFAPNVYQDLVGVDDKEERKRRIIAAAEGHSQALKPPPRPFVGAPPRIASFTGRADELDRLDAILIGGRPVAVTQNTRTGRAAVQGIGGVGKTSLAVEYAYRYRDLYAGVWWCSAESRTDLVTSLARLAEELGVAAVDEADLEKAAQAALRKLAEQRATFLLVYDNVTSPEEISDLLPASGARVLITSRFPDWSGWADEVSLDVLLPTEAVALLENRAGRKDEEGAKILAEALGYLPLALDHAAAYCKRTQMRFADYATKAASLIAAAPRGAAYPRSVAVTFNLAIAQAIAQCPAAEPLMAYLAQCAPERIPMTLVEGAIADESERSTALLALTDVSLLKHDPFEDGTPAVTVHRLVQAVTRADTRGGMEAIERLVSRLAAIYPDDGYHNPASWPLCAQLTPHLLVECVPNKADEAGSAEWAELLKRAGSYFHGRAAYARAEMLGRRALAIQEKVLGAEHPDTAGTLNNLALLLVDQGDLVAAQPLYERALAIAEKACGPEHPTTATSLNNLANLLEAKGDLAGARPLLERALAISERVHGPDHPTTATSLNNLALLLKIEGDLASARPLYERALAIREKVLGPEHPFTASSLNNLATLLHAQGDLAGARPLHKRALMINEKTFGREHPDVALILHNLARLLRDMGEMTEAEQLTREAVAIWHKTVGDEHRLTGRAHENLAQILLATGRPVEALVEAQAAVAAHAKTLGLRHALTRDSARTCAATLDALDRTEEATALRAKYGLADDGH